MYQLIAGLLFLASTGLLLALYQRLVFWYQVWAITRRLNQAAKGAELISKQVADYGKHH